MSGRREEGLALELGLVTIDVNEKYLNTNLATRLGPSVFERQLAPLGQVTMGLVQMPQNLRTGALVFDYAYGTPNCLFEVHLASLFAQPELIPRAWKGEYFMAATLRKSRNPRDFSQYYPMAFEAEGHPFGVGWFSRGNMTEVHRVPLVLVEVKQGAA